MEERFSSAAIAATGKELFGRLGCCVAVWVLVGNVRPATAQMPVRVIVDAVQQGELATGQAFVGTVVPLRTSTVGSTVEGRVVELLVREGDAVKQGDPLARLRTRRLEIQLAAAEAELDLRKQEFAELDNGSRPEEIQQAHAQMLAAEALRDFTLARWKRTQVLLKRKAVSEDDLQEDASAAAGAQQKYLEKKAAWELAVAGPRKEKIAQAKARVLTQEEEVRRLEDDIAEHTITAPFSGHVTKEHTEVGQWVAKGAAVAEIVELDSVDVEFLVLESCLSELRVGQTQARVEISALPDELWTEPISAIVPKADVRSRSFPVKVRLKNRPGPGGKLLKPGMFARVALPVGHKTKAFLVHKDALVLGGQFPTVIVADPPPKTPPPKGGRPGKPAFDAVARQVPVELGAAVGELIEVRGPLKPGQRVVVVGNERVPFSGCGLIIVGDRSQGKMPAAKSSG